uniref:Uncharacterized protein n=1 Tax=Musa acuminata subsp. malaccensis TaxID=214687 RepID=A0A804J592_MUSAM
MLDQALLSPWQKFNSLLKAGMASDARLVVQVLTRECGDVFQGLRSLVDVEVGTEMMAMAIAEAYP